MRYETNKINAKADVKVIGIIGKYSVLFIFTA